MTPLVPWQPFYLAFSNSALWICCPNMTACPNFLAEPQESTRSFYSFKPLCVCLCSQLPAPVDLFANGIWGGDICSNEEEWVKKNVLSSIKMTYHIRPRETWVGLEWIIYVTSETNGGMPDSSCETQIQTDMDSIFILSSRKTILKVFLLLVFALLLLTFYFCYYRCSLCYFIFVVAVAIILFKRSLGRLVRLISLLVI